MVRSDSGSEPASVRSLLMESCRRAGKASLHAELDSDLMFDWIVNFLQQGAGFA